MARTPTPVWKTVGAIAAGTIVFLLVVFLFIGGYLTGGIVVLLVLLAMGGGALLYRLQGPPSR